VRAVPNGFSALRIAGSRAARKDIDAAKIAHEAASAARPPC
jgi:hypothetical protein